MLQAIANRQRDTVLLTHVDHGLTLLYSDRHRLFTPHVFLRTCRPRHELGMQVVRRHHVHHVDVRVVDQRVHRFVTVDVLVFDPVRGLPVGNLGRCARDDTDQTAMLRQLQRRRQTFACVLTKAKQRDAKRRGRARRRAFGGVGGAFSRRTRRNVRSARRYFGCCLTGRVDACCRFAS